MARKKYITNPYYAEEERGRAKDLFEKYNSKSVSEIKKENLFIFKLLEFLAVKHHKDRSKIVYTTCSILPKRKGTYPIKTLKQYGITPFRPRYPNSRYVYLFAEGTTSLERFAKEKLHDRKKPPEIKQLYGNGLDIYPYLITRDEVTNKVKLLPNKLFIMGWRIKENRIVAKRKLNVTYGSEIAKLRWMVFSRTRKADWKGKFEDMQQAYLKLLKKENARLYQKTIRTKEYVLIKKILRSKQIV